MRIIAAFQEKGETMRKILLSSAIALVSLLMYRWSGSSSLKCRFSAWQYPERCNIGKCFVAEITVTGSLFTPDSTMFFVNETPGWDMEWPPKWFFNGIAADGISWKAQVVAWPIRLGNYNSALLTFLPQNTVLMLPDCEVLTRSEVLAPLKIEPAVYSMPTAVTLLLWIAFLSFLISTSTFAIGVRKALQIKKAKRSILAASTPIEIADAISSAFLLKTTKPTLNNLLLLFSRQKHTGLPLLIHFRACYGRLAFSGRKTTADDIMSLGNLALHIIRIEV